MENGKIQQNTRYSMGNYYCITTLVVFENHSISLVHDGYPSELQNLKFGWNFRPTALDGYSIQAISSSMDRFTIQI